MRSTRALLAPLTVLAVALAGCGGGDGDGGGAGTSAVTVVATEYAFDPSGVSLPADTATEVALDNQGIIEHDWTIDELDVRIHAAAGATASASVSAPAGTYEVYCSIPGHRDQGMEGTVTVS